MKIFMHLIFSPLLLLHTQTAVAEIELKTDKQKFSYAVGINIGNNLKQVGDVDVETLIQAINDVYGEKKYRLSPEEMQVAMQKYREKESQTRIKQARSNHIKGKAFLADNKTKDGVIETDSGLQYKIIRPGNGEKPKPSDEIEVHYRGTLINGDEFDSSYKRGEPIAFGLEDVIKGWQEALTMMSVGSKWQIYVPSELGYGERGASTAIGPNETLIFDIELLGIK